MRQNLEHELVAGPAQIQEKWEIDPTSSSWEAWQRVAGFL